MKENYDIFDLTKFICALMVIAIHSNLFPEVLYPWLRLAVPMFFVISSFLLFTKINNSPKEDKWKIIKRFIKKNLQYYLFWFITTLPFTLIERRKWFNNNIFEIIRIWLSQALFSSTFAVSWFITGLIWGCLIISKLSEKLSNKKLMIIFLFIYVICCIRSSYSIVFDLFPLLNKMKNIYEYIFCSPVFSFPVASFWMMIGKVFADGENIKFKSNIKSILLVAFCVLLFIEWKVVYIKFGSLNNDCYLFLAPVTYLLFDYLLNTKININNTEQLRLFSKISFPIHSCFINVYRYILKVFILNNTILVIIVFILTIASCIFVIFLISKLENKERFNLLKYSH